jgi:hypothetical protein
VKRLRVYVDTSVLGGYFDPEFEPWSRGLIDDFRRGRSEVQEAPEPVRDLHAELLRAGAEIVSVTPAALDLVTRYQARKVLGLRFRNDMLHIARLRSRSPTFS